MSAPVSTRVFLRDSHPPVEPPPAKPQLRRRPSLRSSTCARGAALRDEAAASAAAFLRNSALGRQEATPGRNRRPLVGRCRLKHTLELGPGGPGPGPEPERAGPQKPTHRLVV